MFKHHNIVMKIFDQFIWIISEIRDRFEKIEKFAEGHEELK